MQAVIRPSVHCQSLNMEAFLVYVTCIWAGVLGAGFFRQEESAAVWLLCLFRETTTQPSGPCSIQAGYGLWLILTVIVDT